MTFSRVDFLYIPKPVNDQFPNAPNFSLLEEQIIFGIISPDAVVNLEQNGIRFLPISQPLSSECFI